MIANIRTRPLHGVLLAMWLLVMLAAAPGQSTPGEIEFEPVFQDAVLAEPTYLASPDDGTGRFFILERAGIVKIATLDGGDAEVVLDISASVDDTGPEMGLLGLAFAPDFAESGEFFLNYTAPDPRRTVVSRFTMGSDGTVPPDSEHIILEVEQPYENHNAGMLEFGPDGYFYIGFGDGGSGGDPFGHGQNLGTLLGSIIRIDVSQTSESEPYTIPSDNPFVATEGARPEIWAHGFRNPWRFTFDPETQVMYAGDVGENNVEEINIVERGGNYGWNIMEGTRCFLQAGCDTTGLTPPIVEYTHADGSCSVTAGYVYRGALAPSLAGAYIYGDYCSGLIWALRAGQAPEQIFDSEFTISSFGLDNAGELYAVSLEGRINRIREQGVTTATPTPTGVVVTPEPTQPVGTPSPAVTSTPGATSTPTTAPATATPTPTAGVEGDGGGMGMTGWVLIGVGAVAVAAAGGFALFRLR